MSADLLRLLAQAHPDRPQGDLLAMLDPALRKAIRDEKIILTTWRELKERRTKAAQAQK